MGSYLLLLVPGTGTVCILSKIWNRQPSLHTVVIPVYRHLLCSNQYISCVAVCVVAEVIPLRPLKGSRLFLPSDSGHSPTNQMARLYSCKACIYTVYPIIHLSGQYRYLLVPRVPGTPIKGVHSDRNNTYEIKRQGMFIVVKWSIRPMGFTASRCMYALLSFDGMSRKISAMWSFQNSCMERLCATAIPPDLALILGMKWTGAYSLDCNYFCPTWNIRLLRLMFRHLPTFVTFF